MTHYLETGTRKYVPLSFTEYRIAWHTCRKSVQVFWYRFLVPVSGYCVMGLTVQKVLYYTIQHEGGRHIDFRQMSVSPGQTTAKLTTARRLSPYMSSRALATTVFKMKIEQNSCVIVKFNAIWGYWRFMQIRQRTFNCTDLQIMHFILD